MGEAMADFLHALGVRLSEGARQELSKALRSLDAEEPSLAERLGLVR